MAAGEGDAGKESQGPPPAGEGGGGGGEGGAGAEARIRLPTVEELQMQDLMNNCAVRSIMSGVMGGMAGMFFGMLFGSLEQPLHAEQMTTRQLLVDGAKSMASRSLHMGRTFAIMGAIYAGSECVVEKARAKHDIFNAAAAGCMTGGLLSARAGPQAALWGCAGFATFSVAIEKFMERYQE